ncbi:MAG: short-chain dehydrogenase, partial [Bacteroidetes bacterium HGW-Bacteroidetes-22]
MYNLLITGASQGIGAAIVKHFAQQSAMTIFALARNECKLNELASFCNRASNGSKVIPVAVDLDQADYELLVRRL